MAELINTLLLLGAGQGLFLALILATKESNTTANRILAVAMVGYSIFIFTDVYYDRRWHEVWPHLIGVTVPLIYLFGPLGYLYTRAVSEGHHTLHRRSLLHLIPPAVVALYFLPFYLWDGAAKIAYVARLEEVGPPRDLVIAATLQFPYGITYLVLSVLLLRRHRERVKENFSSIERINLDWLRNLTIGFAAVWGVATTIWLLGLAGVPVGAGQSLTPLVLSVVVYAAGYFALRQPEILQPARGHQPSADSPAPVGIHQQPEASSPQSGYEKSGLSPEQAAEILARLQGAMTGQRLYLRHELTLQELAEAAGVSMHNASEAINTRTGSNFYDFVNGYRAEEAMRRLRDPKYANLTILAVADDSGFNSKSVFNAFFKAHTGQTPSQYRASAPSGG